MKRLQMCTSFHSNKVTEARQTNKMSMFRPLGCGEIWQTPTTLILITTGLTMEWATEPSERSRRN